MAEQDNAETVTGPAAGAGARGPGPQPWQHRAAMIAGSTTALVAVSLLGSALGFLNKAACRSGDWNIYLKQFQAHCYTDIYPLYYNEGLSVGRVPYTGHPVEYPVLIGAAMQAVAWLVRPVADPYTRGREFFDLTVVLLALSALGMAAWAARRHALSGVLLGLGVATKFYPLLFFGPLLLLCLRAGRLRAFWVTAGSAAAAWLAVNLPVAAVAPTGWLRLYQLSASRLGDWGSIWYFFETEHWPFLGTLGRGELNALSA